MAPPEWAIVFSFDEKSQIQALDRTQPGLPLKKGRAGTMTHDYKRHGTTTLFAALDVATGEVIHQCLPRHRHQEILRFSPPGRLLHKKPQSSGSRRLYNRLPGGPLVPRPARMAPPGPTPSNALTISTYGVALMPKALPITLYRVRKGHTTTETIIKRRPNRKLATFPIPDGGLLYIEESRVTKPTWFDFFEGKLSEDDVKLFRAHSSAVLLVEHDDRLFAVTFGHGSSMLQRSAIEEKFGLRAALNRIDRDRIISMKRKTISATPIATQSQASRESNYQQFGFNEYRDLMKSVTGKIGDGSGFRVTGQDSLGIRDRTMLDDLSDLIARWHEYSQDTRYQEDFGFIDHIHEVTRAEVRDRLWEELLARIYQGDLDGIWLTPRDIVDWSDVGDFSYNHFGPFVDLRIEDYLQCLRTSTPKLSTLKRYTVNYHSIRNDVAVPCGNVHQCLYGKIEDGEDVYILSDGKWSQVSKGYVNDLRDFLSAEVRINDDLNLPPYLVTYDEKDFNKEAGKNDDFVFFDREYPHVTDWAERFELCDLYHIPTRAFVHVKKWRDRSSSLSHLFAQGAHAVNRIADDPRVLATLHEKRPGIGLDPDSFVASNHEIAYVILAGKKEWPFFTQVNLRLHVKELKRMGYRQVTVTPIPVSSQNTSSS
ncbi:MAG: TIGR04141 family sporadically distributed protein [Gammaproteobacteria bacterium]|nr:TIGR04141 family sporadically distributed protein [Gammaproteobacteria bacterium]